MRKGQRRVGATCQLFEDDPYKDIDMDGGFNGHICANRHSNAIVHHSFSADMSFNQHAFYRDMVSSRISQRLAENATSKTHIKESRSTNIGTQGNGHG